MRHDKESYIITIRRKAEAQAVKDAYAKSSTDGHPAPAPQAPATAQRTAHASSQPASTPAADAMAGSASPPSGLTTVPAPLPGVIIGLKVVPGATVSAGQELAVLEAMKMENSIEAPRPGTVKEVRTSVGDTVSEGTVILVIE